MMLCGIKVTAQATQVSLTITPEIISFSGVTGILRENDKK